MPAQDPVVHHPGLGVDRATDRDTSPQHPPPAEPGGEFGEQSAEVRERVLLIAGRRQHGVTVQCAAAEVGDDEHGPAGADVHTRDAQRVAVDGQRILGPANRFRPGEIGAFDDQTVSGQRVHLTVDGGRRQTRRRGELIPRHRSADPDRMQYRRRRGGGQLQRRRDHSPTHATNVAAVSVKLSP